MATEFDFGYVSFDVAPGAPEERASATAARWFQHLVVLELRQAMTSTAATRKGVADLLGVSVGHLGKKLAGTSPMTLEDLVELTLAFGTRVLPHVGDEAELLPPSCRQAVVWKRSDGLSIPYFREGGSQGPLPSDPP